jgi:hypothetical protein
MDMRRQALVLRHRGKQPAQGAALLRVERAGKPELVLASELGKLAHQPFSGCGEVESVQPAIVGVAVPLDIAAVLEFVDVDDDAARQHPQLSAEGLLAAAGLGGDRAQDSRVGWAQPNGGHLLGEEGCGVMAELRQQEGHAIAVVVGRA